MSGLATRIETDLDVYPMKYHMNQASSCNIKLKIIAPQFCALVKMPIWERTKKRRRTPKNSGSIDNTISRINQVYNPPSKTSSYYASGTHR